MLGICSLAKRAIVSLITTRTSPYEQKLAGCGGGGEREPQKYFKNNFLISILPRPQSFLASMLHSEQLASSKIKDTLALLKATQ